MRLLEVARHRAREVHGVLLPRSWPWRLETEAWSRWLTHVMTVPLGQPANVRGSLAKKRTILQMAVFGRPDDKPTFPV